MTATATRVPPLVLFAAIASAVGALILGAYASLTFVDGYVTAPAAVTGGAAAAMLAVVAGVVSRREWARVAGFVVGVLAAGLGLVQLPAGCLLVGWGVLVAVALQVPSSRAWFRRTSPHPAAPTSTV